MPVFKPPTVDEGPAGEGPLFSRFRITRGETVIQNGTTYTTVRYPSNEDLANATNFWLGGHIYTVDDATADGLIDAGYESFITPTALYPNTVLYPQTVVYPGV